MARAGIPAASSGAGVLTTPANAGVAAKSAHVLKAAIRKKAEDDISFPFDNFQRLIHAHAIWISCSQ
jgi:hypothetical protein